MSYSYKSYTDKVNSWGALVGTIVVTFTAIGAVMGIAIAIVRSLNVLCKSTNWYCGFTLEIVISNELIMFFWGLAAAIVGGGGIAISRYSQKIEKLRNKTANSEQEIIESIHRIAKYDKRPHPFTFAQLTYFDIAYYQDYLDLKDYPDGRDYSNGKDYPNRKDYPDYKNIDNSLYDSEIKANLHHLCRNVINLINLRFLKEYGKVKFHCVSGYRCEHLNDVTKLNEMDDKFSEHENGEAVDINISSGSSGSTKNSYSIEASDLLNKLFHFIMDRNNCGDLPLGRVALTSLGNKHWIHISSSRKGPNKRKFYRIVDGEKEQI